MKYVQFDHSLRHYRHGLLMTTILVFLLTGCGGSQSQQCDGVTAVPLLQESMVVNYVGVNITNTSAEPRLVTLSWREPDGNSQMIQPIRVDSRDSVMMQIGNLPKRAGNTIHEVLRNGYELAISECH